MNAEDVEIISGEAVKTNVPVNEIEGMIDLWNKHLLSDEILRTREDLKSALAKPFSQLLIDEDFLGKLTDEERESIAIQTARQHLDITRAYKKGDLIVARQNGHVVGMGKIAKLRIVGENKHVSGDVFEFGKVLIVPEARGQKIFPIIGKQVLDHLKKKYGDFPVISCTQNPEVKKFHIKKGWKKIGYGEYLRIRGIDVDEKDTAEEIKKAALDGWTAFLYLPKNLVTLKSN